MRTQHSVEQVPSHHKIRKAPLDGNNKREQIAMITDNGETTNAGMSLTTCNTSSFGKIDDGKKNREQRRSLGDAPDRVMKRHDLDLAKAPSLPPLSTSLFDKFDSILLLLIVQAKREALARGQDPATACLAWANDGLAVVVRNTYELYHDILPLAGCQAKFVSFTRKLYRWGFRQVMVSTRYVNKKVSHEKLFHHPLFQRGNKHLIAQMKSVTAEGTRRATTMSFAEMDRGSHPERGIPNQAIGYAVALLTPHVPIRNEARSVAFPYPSAPAFPSRFSKTESDHATNFSPSQVQDFRWSTMLHQAAAELATVSAASSRVASLFVPSLRATHHTTNPNTFSRPLLLRPRMADPTTLLPLLRDEERLELAFGLLPANVILSILSNATATKRHI